MSLPQCPCPQGGDTKLIVSLFEGPTQFKFICHNTKTSAAVLNTINKVMVFNIVEWEGLIHNERE